MVNPFCVFIKMSLVQYLSWCWRNPVKDPQPNCIPNQIHTPLIKRCRLSAIFYFILISLTCSQFQETTWALFNRYTTMKILYMGMEEECTAHFKWHRDLGRHYLQNGVINMLLCSAWSILNKPCKLLSIQTGIWLIIWVRLPRHNCFLSYYRNRAKCTRSGTEQIDREKCLQQRYFSVYSRYVFFILITLPSGILSFFPFRSMPDTQRSFT